MLEFSMPVAQVQTIVQEALIVEPLITLEQ
jgi:hypothetical protein